MKNIVRITVIFIILALVGGSLVEHLYANTRNNCPCCDNKCHGSKNCHENAKACSCSYSVPLQVYLLKGGTLPKPVLLGFLISKPGITYIYLSTKDIFHPPKVNLS
jgi:hypothetical protein